PRIQRPVRRPTGSTTSARKSLLNCWTSSACSHARWDARRGWKCCTCNRGTCRTPKRTRESWSARPGIRRGSGSRKGSRASRAGSSTTTIRRGSDMVQELRWNGEQPRIAVVGLGYVGLPLAVAFGARFDTLGHDLDEHRLATLHEGRDATGEVGPAELAAAVHLRLGNDPAELADRNVYIVAVPTPVDEANRPDLSPLVAASEAIGRVLRPGDLIVYESTVYPGTTEEICVPVLEQASG